MRAEDYSSDVYGDIVRVIRGYGLRPAQARGNDRAFEGPIKTDSGEVLIRFEIFDWDFEKYPRAHLLDTFPDGHRIYAHVDAFGGLCYFAPESIVLDRYRPSVAVHQCLHAIESVLNTAFSGSPEAATDVQNEFVAYWTLGQQPLAKPVLVDELPADATVAAYFSVEGSDTERHAMICESHERARLLVSAIGYNCVNEVGCTCFLFTSEVAPAAPSGSFPTTIREFFAWVGTWDRTLLRRIRKTFSSNADYLGQERCVLALATPSGRFGIEFAHDQVHRLAFRHNPAGYCNLLHGKQGGKTSIIRLRLDEIGPTYIHSRNLEFESLAGKRIKLIGCGAIGGYLATALVRLGAGTGQGGRLTLYDPGILEPDNLGRHTLGFSALFRNKAQALRVELLGQFPYLDVEASGDAQSYTDEFFATDLIIDATGSEAHSEKLNFHHVKRRLSPALYVRIRGNGECVQTLLSDSGQHACFRCLRQAEGGNYFAERLPVLKSAPITRFRGCASFTPYAVSSSLSAAALATDAVIDWLKGTPSPRYRTRHIENADTRRFPNQDLAPIKKCPACHPNS